MTSDTRLIAQIDERLARLEQQLARLEEHTRPRVAYSPEECARLAGVNVHKVYRWIRTGRLPAIRDGRRYIVRIDALQDALARMDGEERLSPDQLALFSRRNAS